MIIVSETVQKFLVDYIKKRNMQPGDKLPSERELVEMLEVGRSSVREALQILTERGIIEKRPGKGAYLKSNFFQCHTNNLQLLIPAMDISTSLDMLEFRKGIETENAFLAAKRRDHESIQTLERSVIDLENCVKNEKPIIVPDLMFHGTLAKSTKNEVIIQVYSSLVEFFKKLRMEMVINDDVDNAFFYHKEILKAIKEKNSEKSSMLMRRHIEDVQLHYKKMLNEMGVND